ncbi:MAG: class I SAM-dependent methyltransferase [Opitutaceae bacterium]
MNFGHLARYYHLLEVVFIGRGLLRARTAQLERLAQGRPNQHALMVGEGNGSFLLAFLEQFPEVRVTVNDLSPEMLEVARARLRDSGVDASRVEFIAGDIRDVERPANGYDLIATHFFFDNFDDGVAAEMVRIVESLSATEAQWLVSDFCMPEGGWRALRAKVWLSLLYGFFGRFAGLKTRQLPATESHLVVGRFIRTNRKTFCGGMLYSSHYQTVHSGE